MDLILWRHAEAEDTSPDIERRLTDKGRHQAKAMAAWLQGRLPTAPRVICSPARRTVETAQSFTTELERFPQLLPGGSVDQLLAAAEWPGANGSTIVVGHQPTIGQTAAFLLTGQAQMWSVEQCAIWWLQNRILAGASQTVLIANIHPDVIELL